VPVRYEFTPHCDAGLYALLCPLSTKKLLPNWKNWVILSRTYFEIPALIWQKKFDINKNNSIRIFVGASK